MDLDFTLVRYRVKEFVSMMYDVLGRGLVTRGYSELMLDPLWKSRALEFTQAGLIVDIPNGNLLELSSDYSIRRAYHGFCSLTVDELNSIYGESLLFPVEPQSHHIHGKYWILYTHFAAEQSAIYSVIVELITRQATSGKTFSDIETDLEQTIYECYDTPAGEARVKDFYEHVYGCPGKYIYQEPSLPHLLQLLREKGFKLVIVTNSYETYTTFVCQYAFGPNWKSLFDDVVVGAGKPQYFKEEHPALETATGFTVRGSFQSLKQKYRGYNITFIGDHFINDVYAANYWGTANTVAIMEEMESESERNEHLPAYLARFTGVSSPESLWNVFLGTCAGKIFHSLEDYISERLTSS